MFAYIVAYITILLVFQAIAWYLYTRAALKDSKKTRGNYYP